MADTDTIDYLRNLEDELRVRERLIQAMKASLVQLKAEREELWREAVFEHGVSRGTCAKFSELDVMVVSRALKDG